MKITERKPSFREFMGGYGIIIRARFGLISEERRDLSTMPRKYFLAHCVAADLESRRDNARV